MSEPNQTPSDPKNPRYVPVAIIGMAGRFPGAPDLAAYWRNLRDGVESIVDLSDAALRAAGVDEDDLHDPHYVKRCALLADIDKFDASFFGVNPREASLMDPAHRLFLETAYAALEHAGQRAAPDEAVVGVFAGSGQPLYLAKNLMPNRALMKSVGEFLVRHSANDMNFLATRVSYELDLRGPSINVQTACSSALVAVHLACRSIALGECDLALAGASVVVVPMGHGYHYRDGEILAPDGHCRPFDAQSAGTVFGSGTGCVVLKRLDRALDDGDTIHAVIRGSAINNDGAMKVGYLAPGVEGQAAAVSAALDAACVPAESIRFVEAHGTGTFVGDPIEVEALNAAYGPRTKARGDCALGSVKSNIGHLGEAAGVAALIKAIYALKERTLPGTLGYRAPNPQIDFTGGPFFVSAAPVPLVPAAGEPLRCGITALGAGGTNCHLILEEAPAPLPGEGERALQVITLSGHDAAAVARQSALLAEHLRTQPDLALADAAFTLMVGRRALPARRSLVARDAAEAIRELEAGATGAQLVGDDTDKGVVFMFPGGGAQYARMGAGLYESEDAYRDAVDACLEIIEARAGHRRVRELWLCAPEEAEAASAELERPSLTLPVLFAAEYALAKLFMSWGVAPKALLGHSMGEYVAACLAGVMSLDDALAMVMLRGQLFERTEKGAMLAVGLSESEARVEAEGLLDLAAVNGPRACVLSGREEHVTALEARLRAREIDATRVRIHVAAHSAMLDPILGEFRKLCRSIRLSAPELPVLSNRTGALLSAAQATDPEYWVQHLRGTVRFADCLATLQAGEPCVFLEVGPGRTLSTFARGQGTRALAFPSVRHPQEQADDLAFALGAYGKLWQSGARLDMEALYDGQLRNRVPLPTYPFEPQAFWVAPPEEHAQPHDGVQRRRPDVNRWFYAYTYREAPLVSAGTSAATRWLVLARDADDAAALAQGLPGDVWTVLPGTDGLTRDGRRFKLRPDAPEDYEALFEALYAAGAFPEHVLYGFAAQPRATAVAETSLAHAFFSPTYLLRAAASHGLPLEVTALAHGLATLGDEPLDPVAATLLGPIQVAPHEYPHLRARVLDLPRGFAHAPAALRARLERELLSSGREAAVALRAHGRFARDLAELSVPPAQPGHWVVKDGTYVISGGLGGIALEVAGHLAKHGPVKLALLSRSGFAEPSRWPELAAADDDGPVSRRARRLLALRELGAEVRVVKADVCDAEGLRVAFATLRRELGPITGVIHTAGTMDDGLMAERTPRAMEQVLAPKIHGTLALDAALSEPVPLFLLFSSVASILGLPGQVDYTAANAFLDHYARLRSQLKPGVTQVIDWNAWRDVGMAKEASRGEPAQAGEPAQHPALSAKERPRPDAVSFVARLSTASDWLVAEHKIAGGSALVPGTGFLELARAAFAEASGERAVELCDVAFLAPFQVAEGETRALRITLAAEGDGYAFQLAAVDDAASPNVLGSCHALLSEPPAALDLAALRARCALRTTRPLDGFLDQPFVKFGPRWANVQRLGFGDGEALIELALPARFDSDLPTWALHPALLDMATGAAQPLIPGFDQTTDFLAPAGYERVRVFAPLTRELVSHVRLGAGSDTRSAHFDITLAEAGTGRVLVAITGFTMRRIAKDAALAATRHVHAPGSAAQRELARIVREGIPTEDGLSALDRALAQPALTQVAIASVDIAAWRRTLDERSGPSGGERLETFARPELATAFTEPESDTERALSEIWRELLGVAAVGVHDDFFELGGNSLLALRLFAAIRKRTAANLPLATLFQAPNVRALAAVVDAARPAAGDAAPRMAARKVAHDTHTLAPLPQLASEPAAWPPSGTEDVPTVAGFSPLVPIRVERGAPSLFCVHGAGGNVLTFHALAKELGSKLSVYGLQAQGVDGGQPLDRVEEMAALYLAHIRRTGPGPYLLAGFSGGGVVAFEMAQQLARAQTEAAHVLLLDSYHPHLRFKRLSLREHIAQALSDPGVVVERIRRHRSQAAEFGAKQAALEVLYRYGMPIPEELRERHVELHFMRAMDAYQPQPYRGPITLFRASVVPYVLRHAGRDLHWGPLAPDLTIVDVPGDHNDILRVPFVATLAREVRACVDRVLARRAAPSTEARAVG